MHLDIVLLVVLAALAVLTEVDKLWRLAIMSGCNERVILLGSCL